MAALWRRLKEEEWGRLLGPCLITFAIPLLVPGFTLTLVAFSDETGFSKFSALHIVGMIILAIASLLLIAGCVLRCKTKNSARVAPDSEGSDVTSLDDTQDSHTHHLFSTHASTVNEQTGKTAHSPSTSETSLNRHPSCDRRTSRSAQDRLTHDIEAVLGPTEESAQDRRIRSVVNRQFSGGGNYMSEDEEDRKALQKMCESAAILQATHDLDKTSSYSSSSSYSTESSSSESEEEDRSGHPPQNLFQSGSGRTKTQKLSRSEIAWTRTEAPVASLALLTANEFGPVDQGRRELTYMEDTDAEQDERQRRESEKSVEGRQRTEYDRSKDEEHVERDDSEQMSKRKSGQEVSDISIENAAANKNDEEISQTNSREKVPEISIENAAAESSSVFDTYFGENQTVTPVSNGFRETQTEMPERKSPPPYNSLFFPPPEPNDTSPDEQNSSDESPSHGSYYFVHPDRQSEGSQRISDEGEVFDENTQIKTEELLTVDETPRPLSPLVPLRRAMGVSEYRTTDSEAENITVFSRSQASVFGSSIPESYPNGHPEITKTERLPSEVEDTGHETGDLGKERKERRRRRKKKKRKKAKKEKREEKAATEVMTTEAEMSPQEVAGEDDLPLKSIMHPQPNQSYHVHWPDEEDQL